MNVRQVLCLGVVGVGLVVTATMVPVAVAAKSPADTLNDPAFNEWMKQVAALPPEEQGKAVTKKLQELNPGFDGKATHKIENGVVTEFGFITDNVTDVSAVRALTGLKVLNCGGSASGKGKLSDLSPLKDIKLTQLNCGWTKVSDLSPLKDMKLDDFRFTPKNITKGMDILRQMKTLKTIGVGGEPGKKWASADFWKRYDAGEFK